MTPSLGLSDSSDSRLSIPTSQDNRLRPEKIVLQQNWLDDNPVPAVPMARASPTPIPRTHKVKINEM